MLFPPSLSNEVLARAFRAPNGELGILPNDTDSFLTACKVDRVEVFGWEMWLVDHRYDFKRDEPRRSPGQWCGLIPTREHAEPAVVGGSSDSNLTRNEIAALKLEELIEPQWLPHVRFNFTLNG